MSTTTVAEVPLAEIDLSDVEFWLQPEAYREGAFRTLRRGPTGLRRFSMALATFALGMALFALFFGLVAACDRL